MNNYQQLFNDPTVQALTDREKLSPRPSTYHESAEVLPLFANDTKANTIPMGSNAVPAPSPSFDAAHSSTDAKLQQMEARLHHHIDTCFDRLVRLTTAKADKTADAVISKSEALEEQVLKALSGQAVRNKLETVEQRLNANAANVAELKRMLQGIHRTLGRLGNEVAQYACKCDNDHADNQAGNGAEPITFHDGTRHFVIGHDSNQYPAADLNARQGAGTAMGRNGQQTTAGQRFFQRGADDLPSFMGVDADGNAYVNIDEDGAGAGATANPTTNGGFHHLDMDGNPVRGRWQTSNGVMYDVPSFMHVFDDGQMIIDIGDEEETLSGESEHLPCGEPIATVIMHIDQNGKPVRGIEGPNGFVYELPSFMKVNEDGFAELIPKEDPFVETSNGFSNPTGWVQTRDGLSVEASTLIRNA